MQFSSFSEYYALKYYSFLITVLPFMYEIHYFHTVQYSMLTYALINTLGSFLKDSSNPTKEISKQLNNNKWQIIPLLVYIFLVYACLWVVWINYDNICVTLLGSMKACFSIALMLAPSIDGSHQLIHRPQKVFQLCGYLGLIPYQFTMYPLEHLYHHHKMVGTSCDLITAPVGMPLYLYYVRAIVGSYKFCFKYNKKIFVINNLANLSYIILLIILASKQFDDWLDVFGKVIFFIFLAFTAVYLMETIQYIQHYGLIVRKTPDDAIKQQCSWNTKINAFQNWSVFRFQRHSDHHMNAYKIYSSMELTDKMPQFPFQFMIGIIWAQIPSFWNFIANPMVKAVLSKQPISKEHLSTISKARIYTVFFISITLIISMYPKLE